MIPKHLKRSIWTALIFSSAMIPAACNRTSTTASADAGKVPITTKSEEARKEFLEGRDFADRLLGHESIVHFDKAIALDPEFATAELYRANNSPTAKEFADHVQAAANLADKVSEGERLLILGTQAGANGDVAKQQEYLEKLVAEFPNDERAQFALGAYYFGVPDMDKAVEHLQKTAQIAPDFSGAYNMLGYAYRQREDYSNAEQAFQKYIQLIPNDPNPYDSYAELLLKEGRFDDSLVQYHKALAIDPHFVPSYFGISADLMYLNRASDANADLQMMATQARNDGELRTAYFGMAVVASDSGKYDDALKAMDKEYAVAEKTNDILSMSADLQAIGRIQQAKQDFAGAAKSLDKSYQIIADSSQPQPQKDNAALLHHFNEAEIALGKKDLAGAKAHAEEFRKGAETSGNPAQVKQVHELAARIDLLSKDYSGAISEFQQANLQDPMNLFRLAQAYEGHGDSAKAREYYAKAGGFNSLPLLRYAFIRAKAQKLAAG